MRFIEALQLIEACIQINILKVVDNKVAIYRAKAVSNPEGWYLESKHDLAQELMQDEAGIQTLTEELKRRAESKLTLDFKTGVDYRELLKEKLVDTYLIPEDYIECTSLIYDQDVCVGFVCLDPYEDSGYDYDELIELVQQTTQDEMLYIKYIQTFEKGYLRRILQQVLGLNPTIQLLVGESGEESRVAWGKVGAIYHPQAIVEHRDELVGFTLSRESLM